MSLLRVTLIGRKTVDINSKTEKVRISAIRKEGSSAKDLQPTAVLINGVWLSSIT